MTSVRCSVALLCSAVGLVSLADTARAQAVIAPDYAASYSLLDLGTPPGVSGTFGGLTLLAGDPNTLLIGGNANNPAGTIFAIGLTRDADNHVTGFSGTATAFAAAPEIDGGLAYGPGGVLFYTGYNENLLGQIKPGSSAPDKVIELGPLGVNRSVGSLNFVPGGFPGAGELRLVTYNSGAFYTASLTPDGSGTFDVGNVLRAAILPSGPEGFVYVPPGSDLFPDPTMLVSEFGASRVSAFDLDAAGIPVVATRRDFVTGLNGAEGGVIDPLSGDFLFSTFGMNNRVIVVGGFPPPVPEPSTWTFLALGLLGLTAATLRARTVSRGSVALPRPS